MLFADSLGEVAISSRALSEQPVKPVNQAVSKLYILTNLLLDYNPTGNLFSTLHSQKLPNQRNCITQLKAGWPASKILCNYPYHFTSHPGQPQIISTPSPIWLWCQSSINEHYNIKFPRTFKKKNQQFIGNETNINYINKLMKVQEPSTKMFRIQIFLFHCNI